jgi:hypothetical protein
MGVLRFWSKREDMQIYKDSEKREWKVVVNVGTAKAVKEALSVDLFNIYIDDANKLFSDPILFVNVLYVLCRKQCEDRKMTDEEFGAALTGDSLEEAANALLTEVANFFPSARAAVMLKLKAKAEVRAEKLQTKAMEMLDALE